jgi:hypothetical protein
MELKSMKNKFAVTFVISVLAAAVLGCSSLNPLSQKGKATPTPKDKTITDKAVDTTVGDEKIGIPECDEVMDMLTAEANDPNDNFIVKAGKAVFFNKIKESIKKSVEDNKNDSANLAKTCKDYKEQLVKFKAEEDKKKGQ